jgi:cell division protein FtsI (penicillin-binding protein 3)
MSRRPRPVRTADERRTRRLHTRVRAAFLLVAFVLSMFAARLIQLQGVDASAYASLAAQESTRTVTLHASRGEIVDRSGVELATSVDGVSLAADPTQTSDQAPEIAAVLSRVLKLDYFTTVDALRTPDTRFAYLARQVPQWQADRALAALSRAGLAGVYPERDPLRVYPNGDVGANLLGFVGQDGVGLQGLEDVHDETMSGTDGHATYMVAPDGAQIPLSPTTEQAPRPGTGLQLTIDRDLQWFAQRRLAQAVDETAGESGVAITMDVDTGQLLAYADYPTFNPNHPAASPRENRGSRAVQNVYEPGSVQKMLTFGALLDAGLVTPRSHIRVPGSLTYDDHTVHDTWNHGDLRLTPTGILARSSNLGTIKSALRMPAGRLEAYLRSFGLGEATNVGLYGESEGMLADSSTWPDIQRANIAFGQGLSVTALQIAAAVNAVANDGMYVQPSLIAGMLDNGKLTEPFKPDRHRVISTRAAEQVQRMLERVTTAPHGTGHEGRIKGYRVAGKTGTSQRVVDGEYAPGQRVISFAGFAPVEDPKYMTYVMIDYPKDGSYGGTACAPVFRDVMGYLLERYDEVPSNEPPSRLPLTW